MVWLTKLRTLSPFPAQRIQRYDILGGLIHEYRDIA